MVPERFHPPVKINCADIAAWSSGLDCFSGSRTISANFNFELEVQLILHSGGKIPDNLLYIPLHFPCSIPVAIPANAQYCPLSEKIFLTACNCG
jgi:hypothetical protein